MTSLAGEFQTDLPLPDALTACVDALDGLGWRVESAELNRVIALSDTAIVEVDLARSDGGTDMRIVGADTEDHPLEGADLIAVLDQARDAIGERIEAAHAERPEIEELPAAGWFSDPAGSEQERYWDGEEWTEHFRSRQEPKAAATERRQPGSWWHRNRRSVAIGAVALLIGGGIGAAASGGDTAEVRTKVNTKTVKGPIRVRTEVKTVTDTTTVKATTTAPQAPAAGAAASGGPAGANCHPSYKLACLDPNSSDYDCEGGSGDGPDYVSGPVTVVGDDPYGLDTDGDGVGCE